MDLRIWNGSLPFAPVSKQDLKYLFTVHRLHFLFLKITSVMIRFLNRKIRLLDVTLGVSGWLLGIKATHLGGFDSCWELHHPPFWYKLNYRRRKHSGGRYMFVIPSCYHETSICAFCYNNKHISLYKHIVCLRVCGAHVCLAGAL